MADVAKRAGVSKSLVSVALSGRECTVSLSDETRQRILAVVEELGYRPNRLAQSLANRRSYLVAMLGREAYFVFALETIKGIEEVLRERHYSLLTYYDGSWAEDQARHLHLALERQVDGLIIAGAPEASGGPNHQKIAALRKQGLPMVQLYRRIYPGVPVVMTDDELAGYQATRHLLELGHVRIAHVTHVGYEDLELPGMHADACLRAQGYCRAMREARLKPRILTYAVSKLPGIDYAGAVQPLVDPLVAGKFTAATCFCDYTAIGLSQQLQTAGVRIPDAFSVIGYDDIDAATIVRPALTTLGQPLRELGRVAARMLFDQMDGRPAGDRVFQPNLSIRGSTAALKPETSRKKGKIQ
jgi:DNA-binding LacI/PurR family transcriptional regulator